MQCCGTSRCSVQCLFVGGVRAVLADTLGWQLEKARVGVKLRAWIRRKRSLDYTMSVIYVYEHGSRDVCGDEKNVWTVPYFVGVFPPVRPVVQKEVSDVGWHCEDVFYWRYPFVLPLHVQFGFCDKNCGADGQWCKVPIIFKWYECKVCDCCDERCLLDSIFAYVSVCEGCDHGEYTLWS